MTNLIPTFNSLEAEADALAVRVNKSTSAILAELRANAEVMWGHADVPGLLAALGPRAGVICRSYELLAGAAGQLAAETGSVELGSALAAIDALVPVYEIAGDGTVRLVEEE